MKLRLLIPTLVAMASFVVFASANQVPITFVNATGHPVTGVTNPPGENVLYYPYVINVDGSNITVACDDFTGEAASGLGYVSTLNSPDGLTNAKFYNAADPAGSTLQYEEAFWLFSNFEPTAPNYPQPPATPTYSYNEVNAAINFAIWDLFEPTQAPTLAGIGSNVTDPNDANADFTASQTWLNAASLEAAGGFQGFNFSNYAVYTVTDANVDNPQEFIGGEVPEPATLALLGSGLLGLGLFFKKRLVNAEEVRSEA